MREQTKDPYIGRRDREYDGPQEAQPENCSAMRQSFHSRLQSIIDQKRKDLVALEELQKHAALIEPNSPLEQLMWGLLANARL